MPELAVMGFCVPSARLLTGDGRKNGGEIEFASKVSYIDI
jgi:hypothetical protein